MGAQREQTISNTSAFVLKTSASPPVIIAPSAGGHTPSERCPLRESRNEVGQSIFHLERQRNAAHTTHTGVSAYTRTTWQQHLETRHLSFSLLCSTVVGLVAAAATAETLLGGSAQQSGNELPRGRAAAFLLLQVPQVGRTVGKHYRVHNSFFFFFFKWPPPSVVTTFNPNKNARTNVLPCCSMSQRRWQQWENTSVRGARESLSNTIT